MNNEIYPLTIILDRYDGAYSGGKWLAFNMDYDEIPKEINSSDIECVKFWHKNKDLIVGRGKGLEEALDDLRGKINNE